MKLMRNHRFTVHSTTIYIARRKNCQLQFCIIIGGAHCHRIKQFNPLDFMHYFALQCVLALASLYASSAVQAHSWRDLWPKGSEKKGDRK